MRRHFLAFYKVAKYRDNAPLKITFQPEKLKIPDECKQAAISQRSIPAMIQTKGRMKTAMKRMFPLSGAPHAQRKQRCSKAAQDSK